MKTQVYVSSQQKYLTLQEFIKSSDREPLSYLLIIRCVIMDTMEADTQQRIKSLSANTTIPSWSHCPGSRTVDNALIHGYNKYAVVILRLDAAEGLNLLLHINKIKKKTGLSILAGKLTYEVHFYINFFVGFTIMRVSPILLFMLY